MSDMAGLSTAPAPAPPTQAGLSMGDVTRLFQANVARGMTPQEARQDIAARTGAAITPQAVDRRIAPATDLGAVVTGGLQAVADIGSGAVRQMGFPETADAVGEFLGPSEEREEALAVRAQERADRVASGEQGEVSGYLGEVRDAIMGSAAQLPISIAGAAAGQKVASSYTNDLIDKTFGRTARTRPIGMMLKGLIATGGAVAGSLAINQPQLYESGYRKAQEEGLDLDDPEVQERLSMRANLGALVEAIVPVSIVNRFTTGAIRDQIERSVAAGAARGFVREGIAEAVTEAMDFTLEQIILDPKIWDNIQDGDRAELLDYFVDRYGREFTISALAGAGIGGPAGGVTGISQQQAQNAAIQNDTQRILAQTQELGGTREQLADLAKTPQGVRQLRKEAEALGRAYRYKNAQLRVLDKNTTGDADPEGVGAQMNTAARADIEADYDSAVDKIAKRLGLPMTTADARRVQQERQEAARTEAIERLGKTGRTAPEGMATDTIAKLADGIENARAAYERATNRVEAITDPERKAEAVAQKDRAAADLREAEVRADMQIEGKSADEVSDAAQVQARREAQAEGREAAIQRQTALEFPETMPETERVAKAQQIVEGAEKDPDAGERGLRDKINRLSRRRRAAEDTAEIDRLTEEIAELEARRGLPTPAVEAARRVLQAREPLSPSEPTDTGPEARNEEGGVFEPPSDVPLTPEQVRDRIADLNLTEAETTRLIADTLGRPLAKGETFEQRLDRMAPLPEPAAKAAATDIGQVRPLAIQERTASQDVTALMEGAKGLDGIEVRLGELMAKHGHEFAAFVDAEGNLVAATTDGELNQVTIPRRLQKDKTLTFTHTHTAQTPFSMSDVQSMLTTRQTFRAILPDGQVVEMKPTGKLTEAEGQSLYSLVSDHIERQVLKDDAQGKLPFEWTVEQRSRLRQEAMLRALDAAQAIQYTRPLKRLTDAEKGYLDGAARRAERHIADLRARADGRARTAKDRAEGRTVGADGAQGAGPISEIAARVTPRTRPAANPERVRELAADVYKRGATGFRRQGQKPYLIYDIQNTGPFKDRDPNSPDRMTEERVAAGINAAAEQIGNKLTYATMHVAKALYPNYDWKGLPVERYKAMLGETPDPKMKGKYVLEKESEASKILNTALWLIQDARNSGKGAFYLKLQDVRNKRTGFAFKTQWMKATDDLMDHLEFTVPERARLYPRLDMPDDTSEVLRSGQSEIMIDEESGDVDVESDSGDNRFSVYALEPARRTARYLQQNGYGIDNGRLNALTPDDMISVKGMAKDGLPRKDEALAFYRSYVEPWTEGKLKEGTHEKKWMDAHARRISERLEQAETDLNFFRRSIAEYRREHGDKPIGWVYQIDDKGRIYANGSFTPQTIEGVKSVFTVDGVSLADMDTVDASASGWQIAALMSRDHVAAPNVNLGEGSGLTPGSPKKDFYSDMITDVRARIEADALTPSSPNHKMAQVLWNAAFGSKEALKLLEGRALSDAILNNLGDPSPLMQKNAIKNSTIAINYGADGTKFTEDLQKVLGERINALYGSRTPIKDMWGYIGRVSYESLRRRAPHTLAYQDWALKSLQVLIKAVEQRAPRSAALLQFGVGLDGTYQRKRHRRVPLALRPRAPNGYTIQRGEGGRILRDDKGQILFSKERETQALHTVKHSMLDEIDAVGTARSIWSQRVQGYDAAVLHRTVERYKQATNGAFVTTNHDSFTEPPEHPPALAPAFRESLKEVMGQVDDSARLYQEIIDQADLYGVGEQIRAQVKPFNDMGSYGLDTLDTASPVFIESDDGKDVAPLYGALPDEGSLLARARDVDVAGYMESLPESGRVYQAVSEVAQNPLASSKKLIEVIEDGYFNRFAPLRRLEVAIKGVLPQGFDSVFKTAELATNDSGRNEMLLYAGAAMRDANGGVTVAPGTVGIYDIMKTAGGTGLERGQRLQNWAEWMLARQAAEYQARGLKTPQTAQQIADALAKEESTFRLAADQWAAHNRANLDFLHDSGRITAAQRDAMQANTLYVPFYRVDERVDGQSPTFELPAGGLGKPGDLLARDPGIKKIVGGDKQKIQSLFTNMIQNSQAMVAAGMRNDAANKAFDLLEMANLASVTNITPAKPTGNSIRIWRQGKEHWLVPASNEAEPYLLAMAGLNPTQLNFVTRAAAKISSVFRQGITIGVPFILRNWIRGATAAGLLTSGANMTPFSNSATGFVDAIQNGPWTQAFKARSGMGDYRFGGIDVGLGQNDILMEFGLVGKGADLRTLGYQWRKVLGGIETLGMATEMADRVAAYKTLVERGVREDEAAYQALTIMNYNRRGGSAIAQFLLPTLPFLNARLQGWSRLTEGAIGPNATPQTRKAALAKLAINGLIYTAISLGAHAYLLSDDEDREKYEAEPLHRKLSYHIFYTDEKTILIPKAFELAHIFATLPELMYAQQFSEAKDLGPGFAKMMADTFFFGAVPQVLLPMIEMRANYNYFTQAPIEGMRESKMNPQDRITNASPLAVFIGRQMGLSKATDVSPAMMEHFFQSYGGAPWTILETGFAILAGDLGLAPVQPVDPFPDIPVAGPALQKMFGWAVRDTDLSSTRWIEDFYKAADKVEQSYNSMRQAALEGRMEGVREIVSESPAIQAQARLARQVTRQLGEISAEVRLVRLSRQMTREEKSERLQALYRARSQLARQATQILQRVDEAEQAARGR